MAIAAWLVWKRAGCGWPLGLYFIQLALNAAWTPVFFVTHAIGLALWLAIRFPLLSFRQVRPGAGWLLVSYLAWTTFATTLNFSLWRLKFA